MTVRSIIFLLASTLALAAGAEPNREVQSEKEIRAQCSDEHFSMASVRECLGKRQLQSEVDLRRAEIETRAAFDTWDEDTKYVNLAKARLAASGKAFANYRLEQCAFAASIGGGAIGNALDMRRAACIAELNNRRAEQLRSAVAKLPQLPPK